MCVGRQVLISRTIESDSRFINAQPDGDPGRDGQLASSLSQPVIGCDPSDSKAYSLLFYPIWVCALSIAKDKKEISFDTLLTP